MKFDDPYKYMISGYYGVESLDEYKNKAYLLKDIRDYINSYLERNRVNNFDYVAYEDYVDNNVSLLQKLEDALILLQDMNASMEVVILIKTKIKEMTYKK